MIDSSAYSVTRMGTKYNGDMTDRHLSLHTQEAGFFGIIQNPHTS